MYNPRGKITEGGFNMEVMQQFQENIKHQEIARNNNSSRGNHQGIAGKVDNDENYAIQF